MKRLNSLHPSLKKPKKTKKNKNTKKTKKNKKTKKTKDSRERSVLALWLSVPNGSK
jgi:hypothetical protein